MPSIALKSTLNGPCALTLYAFSISLLSSSLYLFKLWVESYQVSCYGGTWVFFPLMLEVLLFIHSILLV